MAQIRSLFDLCFVEEGGFNAFFFDNIYCETHTLIYEMNGSVAAMLQRIPRVLRMQGASVPVTYIYGACTHPNARRQALMSKLLAHSHMLDVQQGIGASVLVPQEQWLFDFYQPFGYEPAFFVSRSVGKRLGETCADAVRLTAADAHAMQLLYASQAGTCYVERSEKDWEEQLLLFGALGAGAFGFYEEEKLTAYAFCWNDNIQEGIGLTQAHINTLLTLLGCDQIPITGVGTSMALGCMKWHRSVQKIEGYMNLMFN